MKLDRIKDIANAVLYEGYILYPYRPSSIKNRQRWTFGGVFPKAYAGRQGDACAMQTQLLVQGGDKAAVDVHVRFLQVATREVASFPRPIADLSKTTEAAATPVACLHVDGKDFTAWEEAIEREIEIPDLHLSDMINTPRRMPFRIANTRSVEPIRNSKGDVAGLVIRSTSAIAGVVVGSCTRQSPDLFRITVRIENSTPLTAVECGDRATAQRRAFVSTHTILGVCDGAFVSLMNPPEELREACASCDNQGTWPVLVGKNGDRDTVLSSPIILYDYPDIAAQSAGDLFDATEIDEILTLRILAMTDAEKREMAAADVRARALLERTHSLTAAELAQMHGVMRPSGVRQPADSFASQPAAGTKPRLVSLISRGTDFSIGSEVRLCPKTRGDVMDLALAGQVAVIEAIERDFEDRIHIAVTLRDDPGRDLGAAGFPGHRFYFSQDEIEPIGIGDSS